MSTVFSKNKEKRSRSSSNEANNSFVKNVTSRVSGLLPATITKWFSSPSASNANGSVSAADGTDSSTEDESLESPITTQPPSKRMRFSIPGKFNHFTSSDGNCSTSNIEQCTPYISLQSPPGRTNFARETNITSTSIRASNDDTITGRNERDSIYKSQHAFSNVGPSVGMKRKSIFDPSPSSSQVSLKSKVTPSKDQKASSFKPSLLGSPFYPGQTSYGGASSMYINQPNIKQRRVALVNEAKSSDNTAMSHSARRVMDLLENYSSPLMEARRISQYIKCSKNESLNNNTLSGLSSPQKQISYKTQELHVPSIASILQLKQRSRLMDTTNAARQILASHSSSSDYHLTYRPVASQERQQEKEEEREKKLTTKVKTRVTRLNRGDSSEVAPSVNLPTGVLQIDKDNLPKFMFGTSVPNTIPSTISNVNVISTSSTTQVTEENSLNKHEGTALSRPEIINCALSKAETIASYNSYKFSSPIRISNNTSTPPKVDIPKEKENKTSTPCNKGVSNDVKEVSDSNDWKCSECWVHNKADISKCLCCGATKPVLHVAISDKCAICKISDVQHEKSVCANCEKVKLSNKIEMPLSNSSNKSSNWKCDDCWVSNDESIEKCLCCGAKNPNSSTVNKPAMKIDVSSTWKCGECWVDNKESVEKCACCGGKKPSQKGKVQNTLPSIIKNVEVNDNEWKCENCWIKNKITVDKCAACGNTNSSLKQSVVKSQTIIPPPILKTSNNSLSNIMKSQNDKWECSSCLVRNNANKSKCVCCEADKPGSTNLPVKASFNFGMNSTTTFKFGILSSSESNKVEANDKPAVVPNKPDDDPETNNNTLPKAPSFSFGIPPKKEDLSNNPKNVKCNEVPKTGFTFGITNANAETESGLNKATEEKEKLQEVPKVDLSLPVPKDTPKTSPILFGTSINSPAVQNKSTESPAILPNPVISSKETVEESPTVPAVVNVTSNLTTQKTNTFNFTAPGIRLASNLFSGTSTTSSSFVSPTATPLPVSTTTSLFIKPDLTVSSPMSMFNKPETATSAAILFQKPETTTTSDTPSLATTAPLFSFGNNTTQSTPPQPEKPKFNFTFGNNTSMFNNTFGATTADKSAGANNFSMPGNGLGTGVIGLNTASSLGGGNGHATASPLGGVSKLSGSTNELTTGNDLQAGKGLFGSPIQKENLWASPNNSTNSFAAKPLSDTLKKPPTYSFGSGIAFNASSTPAVFGSSPAPTVTAFGMNHNASTPLFSTPAQNSVAPSIFSGAQAASKPVAAGMGLFGTPSVPTPAFGTSNSTMPSFETSSIAPATAPAPVPAFNFGVQQATNVFGFGQQQAVAAQQAPAAGVYSFGGASQVQFNIGSAPSAGIPPRRVRKAVRRNPPR